MTSFQSTDQETIAEPFMELPSRRELPEYYDIIKNPMDFNRIKKKLDKRRYLSLQEFAKDIYLLTINCQVLLFSLLLSRRIFQTFNADDSEIFHNSKLLEAAFEKLTGINRQANQAFLSQQVAQTPGPSSSTVNEVSLIS